MLLVIVIVCHIVKGRRGGAGATAMTARADCHGCLLAATTAPQQQEQCASHDMHIGHCCCYCCFKLHNNKHAPDSSMFANRTLPADSTSWWHSSFLLSGPITVMSENSG